MDTVEVAGAYPPPKKVCHVSGRENKKESNGSLLPASEETHRGDQPTSLCFTAFGRGEAPDKLHHESDYDPEVCPDSSQLNSTCPTGHNMKIYNLLTGLLVSFPIWPHLPWIQSPKWPCKTEIRPGLSPLRMIRATHITHSTNKPQTYQPGWRKGLRPADGEDQRSERRWAAPTVAAPPAPVPPPTPRESTGRNFRKEWGRKGCSHGSICSSQRPGLWQQSAQRGKGSRPPLPRPPTTTFLD